MKRLLLVSAILEILAGVAALLAPGILGRLLLGGGVSEADAPLVRLGGAGLVALGVACWLVRRDAPSRSASGLGAAMLVYNLGAVIVLGAAGMVSRPVGFALWPAVVLHVAMAGWCIAALRARPA